MGMFTVYPIFLGHLSGRTSKGEVSKGINRFEDYLPVHFRSPASAGFALAPLRLGLASARSFRRS